VTALEKEIEKKLRKAVEAAGGKCVKWVSPGWAGVPDRLVLLPGGLIVFVETKRPKGGQLSKLQEKWAMWLHDLGFKYEQVWDLKDLAIFKFVYLEGQNNETN
jgi:hypothetical protein